MSTSECIQYLHLLIEFSTACTTLRQSCSLVTLYQHNQLFKSVCCSPVSSSSIVLKQCMNDSFQCKDQWGITWMSHGDGSLFISNVDTCEEGGASLAWLMRCLSMSMPYSCWDLWCRKQGRLISNHPPPKVASGNCTGRRICTTFTLSGTCLSPLGIKPVIITNTNKHTETPPKSTYKQALLNNFIWNSTPSIIFVIHRLNQTLLPYALNIVFLSVCDNIIFRKDEVIMKYIYTSMIRFSHIKIRW